MTPEARIGDALGVRPVSTRRVSGGCISEARRVELADGRVVFAKTHSGGAPEMFPAEAAGLQALAAAPGGPPVPRVLHADAHLIIMEWLAPGRLDGPGWQRFGRAFAALHRTSSPDDRGHGFEGDNFIGATPQRNDWDPDGAAFFAKRRLGFQVRLARDQGYLDSDDVRQAEGLTQRIPELLSPCVAEPPSLLHGDLWSGNVHARSDGVACLVDPAAYFGFREADLAMTRLFGAFPRDFYAAYEEAWPLPVGAEERVGLFNLYHLLNHLNLFGEGYLGQVRAQLRRGA